MKRGMKINWKVLIVSFALVYLTAFVGSLFTSGNINSEWYQSVEPSITPPNWVFPVVWNILFFLIALSLYFVWIKSDKKQRIKVAILFGTNLFLNLLWSFLFFFLQNPLIAFFDLILLWFSIILIIYAVRKISKISSYLLVPYLLWVSFAGILNYLSAFV